MAELHNETSSSKITSIEEDTSLARCPWRNYFAPEGKGGVEDLLLGKHEAVIAQAKANHNITPTELAQLQAESDLKKRAAAFDTLANRNELSHAAPFVLDDAVRMGFLSATQKQTFLETVAREEAKSPIADYWPQVKSGFLDYHRERNKEAFSMQMSISDFHPLTEAQMTEMLRRPTMRAQLDYYNAAMSGELERKERFPKLDATAEPDQSLAQPLPEKAKQNSDAQRFAADLSVLRQAQERQLLSEQDVVDFGKRANGASPEARAAYVEYYRRLIAAPFQNERSN